MAFRLASRIRTSRMICCDARTVMREMTESGAYLAAIRSAPACTPVVETSPASINTSPRFRTFNPSPGKAAAKSC